MLTVFEVPVDGDAGDPEAEVDPSPILDTSDLLHQLDLFPGRSQTGRRRRPGHASGRPYARDRTQNDVRSNNVSFGRCRISGSFVRIGRQ